MTVTFRNKPLIMLPCSHVALGLSGMPFKLHHNAFFLIFCNVFFRFNIGGIGFRRPQWSFHCLLKVCTNSNLMFVYCDIFERII